VPQQEPLSLNIQLHDIGITPSPIPPSAPVVNPAPPSGSAARKEAKQRQAATAKSEEGAGDAQGAGDLAEGPPGPEGMKMTRHDPPAAHPFTALSAPRSPSAWPRDLLYGGSIGVAAAILALGFTVLRSRPRRRPPAVPVPAWARAARRRR
jgi:hypothetical protein